VHELGVSYSETADRYVGLSFSFCSFYKVFAWASRHPFSQHRPKRAQIVGLRGVVVPCIRLKLFSTCSCETLCAN
jgi:hypothetical protein